ncbi:MAG: F0F1 ATP synthase subunit epsilon [Candidatus Omnitrophica bacterium]|nr:F0F1 ATP synthase subunit epsilon [Candidatus Omnitrophota bacterium]
MSNLFHIDIVGPEKIIYSGEIISLVVPAEFGYLGVLANHAPLIAHLVKGKITLRDNTDATLIFDIRDQGFIEVLKNNVTLVLGSDGPDMPDHVLSS